MEKDLLRSQAHPIDKYPHPQTTLRTKLAPDIRFTISVKKETSKQATMTEILQL